MCHIMIDHIFTNIHDIHEYYIYMHIYIYIMYVL